MAVDSRCRRCLRSTSGGTSIGGGRLGGGGLGGGGEDINGGHQVSPIMCTCQNIQPRGSVAESVSLHGVATKQCSLRRQQSFDFFLIKDEITALL
eukprot:981726-Prorocentrum_minimum.AAC.1